MSYSSDAKEELCRLEPDSICCLLAELSGIVSAAGSVIYRGGGDKRLSIETENTAVARRAFRLLRDVFDVQPQLVTLQRARLGGRSSHRIEISGDEASFVLEGCGIQVSQRRGVPREVTVRKCCRMSFLRGVFLASGSVTDPEKEYHLEFVLGDEAFAAALQRLIARFDLEAGLVMRRQMAIVYLKGQNAITDMLSIFGAQSARFAMEDAFIRKELRNNANRAVNCDSANMERAVIAASRQTQAIGRLIAAKGEQSLSRALLETAKLRLAYPEVSLEELGRLCDPPVGKSGVNHRLRKLEQMARELDEEGKETPDEAAKSKQEISREEENGEAQ
ncbi:MAG: DNA-binding protein WhiA [Clostridia bacterium]|nr:DNA-binding protein WhiA [Clostridia bacterium]